jgi:beta-lactamase regulating signal transducer with metallopeptidase domain
MANSLLEAAISNVLVAGVLALTAILVTRLWRSSQVAHLLWLLVLAKLITPPLWRVQLPALARDSSNVASTIQATDTSDSLDLNATRSEVLVPAEDARIESSVGLSGPYVEQVNRQTRVDFISGGFHEFLATTGSLFQRTTGFISSHASPISLTWFAASVLCATTVAFRVVRFNRLLRQTLPASDELSRLTSKIAQRLSLEYTPSIRLTPATIAPLVWPATSPATIVLPTRLVSELSDEQLSMILAHELAHLKRHDHWVRFLEVAVVAAYWWNPVVWWARRELHAAEEACCDSRVMQIFPTSAVAYGDALLRTNQFVSSGCVPAPLLASGFREAGDLKRRVAMILNDEFGSPVSRKMHWALAFIAICVLPVTARGILAQDEPPKPAAKAGDDPVTDAEEPAADAEIQQLLQTLGTKEARPFQALNDLIKLGDKVIEPTRVVMNDRELHFGRRWQSAKILGVLKAKVAVPDLLAIIEGDDNAVVARVAAWSLGEMGDPAIIPRLKKVLENASDPLFKKSLEDAIAVLEGREPVRVFPTAANLDFESGARDDGAPIRWGGGGVGYELALDAEIFHQGKSSGRVKRIADGGRGGSLTNGTSAVPYRGKRLKYSGFLRSQDAGTAGLWMRVDSIQDGVAKPIAFDNMSTRPIKGTTEWNEYAVVLDVPPEATSIAFGILLTGQGTLWGDDLKIEIVGNLGEGADSTGIDQEVLERINAAITARDTGNLANMDFEQGAANDGYPKLWGGGGTGYKLSIDSDKSHQGAHSGRIERVGQGDRFGSFTRSVPVTNFLSKRIMYSGYLSTENAESAVLWMRIDGVHDGQIEPIDFSNTTKQGGIGTTDWTEYSIVLDVPPDAKHVTFGFLLTGAGIVWGDDLKIEVVGEIGQGPETTGVGRERMKAINEANRERKASQPPS